MIALSGVPEKISELLLQTPETRVRHNSVCQEVSWNGAQNRSHESSLAHHKEGIGLLALEALPNPLLYGLAISLLKSLPRDRDPKICQDPKLIRDLYHILNRLLHLDQYLGAKDDSRLLQIHELARCPTLGLNNGCKISCIPH